MIPSKYNIIVPVNDKSYIFNLASQCLVEINEELTKFLNGEIKLINFTDEEKKELHDNGIIVDNHNFETARLKANINFLKFDRSKMGAFLSTTSGCNLSCTYCYQDIRKDIEEKKYISKENWGIILNHFRMEIKKNNTKLFAASIFGGEPMLGGDMCKKIIKDLRELQDDFPDLNLQCVLITNGTLFNEENVEFYLNNVDNIQITLDGLKEINDQFRIYPDGSGSFDKIINSIKLLDRYRTEDKQSSLCLRVNVNRETVDKAKQFINYLVENNLNSGITSIDFHEIFSTQRDIIEKGSDLKDKDIELAKEISNLNFYLLDKGIKVFRKLGGPCLGKMSTGYVIDEELNIYACPGLLYSEVQGKIEKNGNIDIENKRWFDFFLDDFECVDTCKYAPICYGGCTWEKGENERNCMRHIYDATLISNLQAYIFSKYV